MQTIWAIEEEGMAQRGQRRAEPSLAAWAEAFSTVLAEAYGLSLPESLHLADLLHSWLDHLEVEARPRGYPEPVLLREIRAGHGLERVLAADVFGGGTAQLEVSKDAPIVAPHVWTGWLAAQIGQTYVLSAPAFVALITSLPATLAELGLDRRPVVGLSKALVADLVLDKKTHRR